MGLGTKEYGLVQTLATEQQVLSALNIPDFRHITKDKVVEFASLLAQMDPEVAKKALEQFPQFAQNATVMVGYYKEIAVKMLVCNDADSKSFYDTCNTMIASMEKTLERDLSPEDRQTTINAMVELARLMNQRDENNKRWYIDLLKATGPVICGGMVLLAAVLGVNPRMSFPSLRNVRVNA